MSERSSNDPDKQFPAKKPSKHGKLIKRAVLLALLAAVITAGVVIYLVKSEPAYWKEHERFLTETSPQQIQQLAGQVQDKLEALANLGIEDDPSALPNPSAQPNVRPEDVHINTEQTLTLDNEQLAAVVQLRLDEWMQERGYVKPDEVQDPMITVSDGDLVMAFKLNAGKLDAIISGKFLLLIRDDGMAELTLKRFLVGKLPVPADMIGEHLRKQSGGDPRAAQVGEWLGKLQHFQLKPVLELEHRRRARVMAYKTLKDSLELTVRIQDHKTYKAMNQALAGVPVD